MGGRLLGASAAPAEAVPSPTGLDRPAYARGAAAAVASDHSRCLAVGASSGRVFTFRVDGTRLAHLGTSAPGRGAHASPITSLATEVSASLTLMS